MTFAAPPGAQPGLVVTGQGTDVTAPSSPTRRAVLVGNEDDEGCDGLVVYTPRADGRYDRGVFVQGTGVRWSLAGTGLAAASAVPRSGVL